MCRLFNQTPISLMIASALLSFSAQAELEINQDVEVITVSGYKQQLNLAPASISVIDAEEIENKAYADITQVLQDIPGLFSESGANSKGGGSEVSIRGFDSKYSLILVNGRPQGSSQAYYNGFGRGNEFGWLPPLSSIDRIEVVRGPMSSLYGSDALGGVINVITKRSQDKWTGEVSIVKTIADSSKSGDSEQLRYFVSGPLASERLVFTLSGNAYKRDEDQFFYGIKKKDNLSNSGRLDWYLSDMQSLSFEVGVASQDQFGTANVSNAPRRGRASDSALKTDRVYYTIGHDIAWGYFDTVSYFQSEKVEMNDSSYDSEYIRHTFNTQTTFPLDFGKLVAGGQYKYQEADHSARSLSRGGTKGIYSRSEYAVFGEMHWEISEDFNLTGGLRYVNDEFYGGEVIPRAYAVYQLSEQFTLKGGVSKGYITPDLNKGDSAWVEGYGGGDPYSRAFGNSDLKPESSTNYEMALLWDSENWAADVTVYQSDFNDKIVNASICDVRRNPDYDRNNPSGCERVMNFPEPLHRVIQTQNVDEAELKGVESSLRYSKDSLSINLNHTFTDSEQLTGRRAGFALNNTPKHMVNLGLNWSMTDSFKVWGRIKYRSISLTTSGRRGDVEVPAYTMADIGANYDLTQYLNVYAAINNLNNKTIDYDTYFKTLEGRRFSLGIRAKF
ncbi:MAG: TonB-dependent receptor domain-containing protein [Parashewanella sp.]